MSHKSVLVTSTLAKIMLVTKMMFTGNTDISTQFRSIYEFHGCIFVGDGLSLTNVENSLMSPSQSRQQKMSPTSVSLILFEEMLKMISPFRTRPIQRFKEGIRGKTRVFHNKRLIHIKRDLFDILRTLRTRIIPIQGSCGASLNGEFWIIGGWNEGRQVFITVNRVTIGNRTLRPGHFFLIFKMPDGRTPRGSSSRETIRSLSIVF